MKQYLENLNKILNTGVVKGSARDKMPRTKEIFPCVMEFDLQEGFPLLTTKKMSIDKIVSELLWFLSGSTNILDLHKNNCHIWDQDCYRLYQRKNPDVKNQLTFEKWVALAKEYSKQDVYNKKIEDKYECGQIYGKLWRSWPSDKSEGIDQITKLVNTIINNPNSRYQIVSVWNPKIVEENKIALPSCHCFWQTCLRPIGEGDKFVGDYYIDLAIYQRSCDYMLGVPYNIASYAILIHLLAILTGNKPGKLTWIGGSTHVYENHVEKALVQLTRAPKQLPTLNINTKNLTIPLKECLFYENYSSEDITKIIGRLTKEDFTLTNYEPFPAIKFEFSSGLNESEAELIWPE